MSVEERLVADICSLKSSLDTKETNFFLSVLLTGTGQIKKERKKAGIGVIPHFNLTRNELNHFSESFFFSFFLQIPGPFNQCLNSYFFTYKILNYAASEIRTHCHKHGLLCACRDSISLPSKKGTGTSYLFRYVEKYFLSYVHFFF